ncbi:restriction endonuclease subunit S [Fusobacterium polymorphum]|uniref:Restriction endonuclease subunit S n=1 Tax=Fusobacterium nucleatum subsp. polymorphum TaxID=76857 RepID=A0A2C6BN87_FUSNP|nr:restriction endonuclease subunit S [Fusobacterium polymorphum]PHI07986.1 restriction endonuclease subunit S [Fusobacterium polymorphum]
MDKYFYFDDIFEDYTKYSLKISKNLYLKSGLYPIIDQGKEKIAGYSDKNANIFDKIPVIIFGDHTRIFKYIDYPFFLGADGVKILKNTSSLFLDKYLYYSLKNFKIPNTGYNRHFKWLKDFKIKYISLVKQEKIVSLIEKIEYFILKKKEQLKYLKKLNKSLFIKFNKNGVEKQLDEVADIIMGQSPLSQSYNIDKKGLPFYQGKTEFGDMYIKESNIYCNSPIKIAEKNDILMSVRAPVGDVNIAIHKSCIGRGLASIRAKKIDYLYLFYLLKEQKTRIEKMGVGSTFKAINKNNISSLKMSIVEMNKQNKIKKYLILTEKLSFEIEKSIKEAQNLYDNLMNEYFD